MKPLHIGYSTHPSDGEIVGFIYRIDKEEGVRGTPRVLAASKSR
jgi:hypothetical protein